MLVVLYLDLCLYGVGKRGAGVKIGDDLNTGLKL